MIIDWLAAHGLMFLIGVTLILGLGCIVLGALKEPLLRQRCSELTIACALLWLIAAMIPLPRLLVMSNVFGRSDFAATARNVSPLDVPTDLDSPSQADAAQAAKANDVSKDGAKLSQAESSELGPVEILNTAHNKHRQSNSGGAWWMLDAKQIPVIAAWGYLSIIMLCGIWLAIGRVLVWWIVSGGSRISEQSELMTAANLSRKLRRFDFASRVRVVQSPRCAIPFTYGILQPTIVLPSADDDRSEKNALVHALRHEWAHVQRGDAIGRAVMNAAFPLLAIHPLYWLLRRSAIFASELLADESAAEGSDRATYSTGLIVFVQQQRFMRRLILGASPIVSSKSEFYRRIELLLKRTKELRNRMTVKQRWSLAGVSVLFLCVAISVIGINGPGLLRAADGSTLQVEGIEFTDDWNINNIVSTSREMPAVAIVIPTSQTVEVTGTILGTDNAPLEGATVWAAAMFDDLPLRERVQTDSKGRYVLHLKRLTGKDARWEISAFKGNQYGKVDANLAWIQSDDPKQPMPLFTQLTDGAAATCRILEAGTNKPIPNARLYLNDSRIFISDANGVINIEGIKNGTHELAVLASDFARVYRYFDNTAQSKSELNVYLPKANRIVGKITDESGQGIPHAGFIGLVNTSYFLHDAYHSLADRDGNFSWQSTPKDRPIYAIAATAIGYEEQQVLYPISEDDRPLQLSFKLPTKKPVKETDAAQQQVMAYGRASDSGKKTAGAIVGRVVDANGTPIKDFQVFSATPLKYSGMERVNYGSIGFKSPMSFTSSEGRFILGHEINSEFIYRVMVRAEGFGDAIIERVVAGSVADVAKAEEHVFEMKAAHTLDVQVSAANLPGTQKSIPAAKVTLIDNRPHLDYLQFDWSRDEFRYRNQLTNDQGLASFSSIPFGEATVAVRASGYARQRFGWRNGESRFDVTLVPEASITVKTKVLDGSIPKDTWWSFQNLGGVDYETPIKDDLSFRCDGLPADSYVLELSNSDQKFCRHEFSVVAGESVNFELTMDKGAKTASLREVGRTHTEVTPEAIATINGRDPSRLSFKEGLDRFKKYTRLTESESITEEQLRRALAKAAIELKGILREDNKEAVAAALKKLAEGNEWPFGVRLYANDRLFLDSPIDYSIYIPHSGSPSFGSPTVHFTIDP